MSLAKAVAAYTRYDELKWMVEVRVTGGGGGSWWEPICAYNSEVVAKDYARACRTSPNNVPKMDYRVTERTTDEDGNAFWKVVDTGVRLRVAP